MKTKKRALITGITGQDGSYLAEYLVSKGYTVYGLVRRSSNDPFVRVRHLRNAFVTCYGNMRDAGTIREALKEAKPNEIYNLAAQSDVGISFKCPDETMEVNYHGLGRLVHAAMDIVPDARIYQASTSEMFGSTKAPQNEDSPMNPVSPYAIAKLRAHEDYVVGYRKKHNLFICSGILFNHESPRRGENFVTRKITLSFARITQGLQNELVLGNLDAFRDWGFAGDYVEAMWLMMQQEKPDDFVIGTGETHTVRDFVEKVAEYHNMKLTWEGGGVEEVGRDQEGKVRIRVSKDFYRPHEVDALRADPTKILSVLNWKPKMSFDELVHIMAKSDTEYVKRNASV
ncbi:MAG: GDP-mannose 4,6-dehydratase [Candidatus Paceibacterota bacterium]